jgi:hypothetical protein
MNNQYAIVLRQSSNQTGSGAATPINLFGGVEDPLNKELVDTAYVSRPMNPHVNKKSKKAEIKPPIPSKEVQTKGKNVYSF